MLNDVTISLDLNQLLGGDIDTRRTRVYVKTNVTNNTLIDTSTGETRLGDERVTLEADGTGSFTTWGVGADGNPTSWQTYVVVEYPRAGSRDRVTRTFGPYTITDADNGKTLAELEDQQAIPPNYQSAFVADMEAIRDEAEAARDAAVDISNIDTSDGVVSTLIEGTAGAGPLTRSALSASFAPSRVTDFGAEKDDATDDATAIQALVNTVRDAVRTAGMNVDNVVRIPAGVYEIGSTITVPPYVKLQIDGTAIFRYTGTSGTAFHFTPLADDPVAVYSGLVKQQWTNTPTIIGGGLVLIGAGGTSVGMEVGSRTDLGATRPMRCYRIGNVSISGFFAGLKLNTHNHYIGAFDNLHLELNTHQIQVGTTGTANNNSGENFCFDHCTMAGGTDAVWVAADSWDLNFLSCSFDYMDRLATVERGYGRLYISGGHVEAINQELDAGDGVIVSTVEVSDDVAHVQFDGTTFLVKAQPMFKGTRLAVSGTIYQRDPSAPNTTFPNSVSTETTVKAVDLHNRARLIRRIVTFEHNRINDPSFATETLGVKAGDLAAWDILQEGTTVEVVNDPAVSGGKAVQLTIAAGFYCLFTALTAIPLRGLDERYATLAIKVSAPGIHAEGGAIYTRPDGTEYTAESRVDLGAESLTSGAYRMPDFMAAISPSANLGERAGVKPQFLISNPTGSSKTVTLGYVYFGE